MRRREVIPDAATYYLTRFEKALIIATFLSFLSFSLYIVWRVST